MLCSSATNLGHHPEHRQQVVHRQAQPHLPCWKARANTAGDALGSDGSKFATTDAACDGCHRPWAAIRWDDALGGSTLQPS